jgi:ech hydrogenase subunit B
MILVSVLAIVVTPFVGGLLRGVDRKLTARMQGRRGPPIQQPFYDVLKLLAKQTITTNRTQLTLAYAYLVLVIAALVLFALRQDLLMVVLVLGVGSVCLVLGSLSVKSPYSQFGGHRELLQMLAYEPILILVAVAIYLKTGAFFIKNIFDQGQPLLPSLWVAYLALLIVLIIVMRKSPFDISASEHAHQEIVRGVFTEYSGPYLAMVELAHWYESVLLLGIIFLLWTPQVWPGVLLALFSFFVVLVTDNITARLTWSRMLRISWIGGLGLVVLNLVGLRFFGG